MRRFTALVAAVLLVLRPAILKVKPTRAGKARLRRGGSLVSVVVGGGGRFVTRKVKIVR